MFNSPLITKSKRLCAYCRNKFLVYPLGRGRARVCKPCYKKVMNGKLTIEDRISRPYTARRKHRFEEIHKNTITI